MNETYDLDEDHGRLWVNADLKRMPEVVIVANQPMDRAQTVTYVPEATLGRGTCEIHDCEGSFSAVNRPVWRCDCGAFMTQYTDATTYHKPRFCPNCGRKVVSE